MALLASKRCKAYLQPHKSALSVGRLVGRHRHLRLDGTHPRYTRLAHAPLALHHAVGATGGSLASRFALLSSRLGDLPWLVVVRLLVPLAR